MYLYTHYTYIELIGYNYSIEDILTSLCHGTATRDGLSNGGVPFQRRAKLGPQVIQRLTDIGTV